LEQEFEVPQSISTLKNGFFGPQNSNVSLEYMEKAFFSNFESYDLGNGME
jgi:hypothetical protein